MRSSLWIYDDLVVILIEKSSSSVEISLDPVTILVDKHRMAFSVLDELIPFIIETVYLSIFILLNAVSLLIVSDDFLAWQDGDFVALIIVVVEIAVPVPNYSEAKFVEFLPFACFGVLPHGEAIFWVVGLPLSVFVKTYILSLLVLE